MSASPVSPPVAMMSFMDPYISVLNKFLAKSEGKDKLLATIQYAAMLISAGQPGMAQSIQKNLVAARKPLRILKPVELVAPMLTGPPPAGPLHLVVLNKAKTLLSALYFGCDHIVWAGQTGIFTDKDWLDLFQKASIYGWLGASTCTIIAEALAAAKAFRKAARGKLTDEEKKVEAAAASKRSLVLLHAVTQAALAVGLLQLGPLKGRTRLTAACGVITSLLACYMVLDPVAIVKPKSA